MLNLLEFSYFFRKQNSFVINNINMTIKRKEVYRLIGIMEEML